MFYRFHFPIIVIIALMLAACGNEKNDQLSATDAVRNVFTAYQHDNRDTLTRQFCDPALADLTFPNSDGFRFTFSDLTFTELDAADSGVLVTVAGSVRANQSGGDTAAPFRWTVDLRQRNSTWCVTAITQTPDS